MKDTSRDRATQLDSLHSFVSRATTELIWLNEKEEEEVAYDWSDRNSSMLRKKDYHAVRNPCRQDCQFVGFVSGRGVVVRISKLLL